MNDKTQILKLVKQKSALIQTIRNYFNQQGYLEVITPTLTPYPASEAFIDPVEAFPLSSSERFFLITSPEYYMKRLLKLGASSIYQISSVFRRFEQGELHKPEFTMLEWYSTEFNYQQIMQQAIEVVKMVLKKPDVKKISYQNCWLTFSNIDPLTSDKKFLEKQLDKKIDRLKIGIEINKLGLSEKIDIFMGFFIQPKLAKSSPTLVYDFLADEGIMAKLNSDKQTAARFEIYYKGIELCNGYLEMTDEKQIIKTLKAANRLRKKRQKTLYPLDKHFLKSAKGGLPTSSGVALGVDRLLAVNLNQKSLTKIDYFKLEK